MAGSPSDPARATRAVAQQGRPCVIRAPSRAILAAASAPPPCRSRMASTSSAVLLPPTSATTTSRSVRPVLARRQTEQLCQRADRHDTIVQDEAVVGLEAADAIGRQAYGFQHGIHGNTEELPSRLDDHDPQKRDLHWKVERHGRAGANPALHRRPARRSARSSSERHPCRRPDRTRPRHPRPSKSRRRKPGRSPARRRARRVRRRAISPFSRALRRRTCRIDPAAVVRDLDDQAIAGPCCRNVSRAGSGFRPQRRWSGVSMPWSSALRIRCSIGSNNRSAMVLSASVISPSVTNVTSLPSCCARSRTARGNDRNTWATGTMRSCNAALVNGDGDPLHRLLPFPDGPRKDATIALGLRLPGQMRNAVGRNEQFTCEIDKCIHARFVHAQRAALGARHGSARRARRQRQIRRPPSPLAASDRSVLSITSSSAAASARAPAAAPALLNRLDQDPRARCSAARRRSRGSPIRRGRGNCRQLRRRAAVRLVPGQRGRQARLHRRKQAQTVTSVRHRPGTRRCSPGPARDETRRQRPLASLQRCHRDADCRRRGRRSASVCGVSARSALNAIRFGTRRTSASGSSPSKKQPARGR